MDCIRGGSKYKRLPGNGDFHVDPKQAKGLEKASQLEPKNRVRNALTA